MATLLAILRGLAALPEIIKLLKGLNLEARLAAIEKKHDASIQAFTTLANAKSREDYAKAAKELSNSFSM